VADGDRAADGFRGDIPLDALHADIAGNASGGDARAGWRGHGVCRIHAIGHVAARIGDVGRSALAAQIDGDLDLLQTAHRVRFGSTARHPEDLDHDVTTTSDGDVDVA